MGLISSISSGGGFVVREEREEFWNDVKTIRPLRDITSKECGAWLHWAKLNVIAGGVTLSNDQGITRLTRGQKKTINSLPI